MAIWCRVCVLPILFASVLAAADGPCDAISRFAQARLHVSAASIQDLNEDLNHDLKKKVNFPCRLPKQVDLDFLIATVPNPIETHLALWFDRELESILNSAGSVGFRFQEAWVPWDTNLIREETDFAKRNALAEERERREKMPGVLLLRNSVPCPHEAQFCRNDLVVLLVPETPTGGIEPNVFADAEKMIVWAARDGEHRRIPVMGPSFSGSFASLGKILDSDAHSLDVVSGTSASREGWRETFEAHPQSHYAATVHDLATQFQMLQQQSREWKPGANIALLTETETSLGWFYTGKELESLEKRTEEPALKVFRYPRQISRLRNAYGDEVLKAVVGAQPQSAAFRNLLGFRLFDVGSGSDSTPVLAKNQSPLSQDAVLREIARSLERERVTLAGILATDVFDALFIARYLRDACPDIRLFTFDSDYLYERAAEDYPFDGMLALATYPLVASNQRWTNLLDDDKGKGAANRPAFFAFPSRGAEGIYNATRVLLIRAGYVSSEYRQSPLVEYRNPSVQCKPSDPASPTGCYQPPVWLTVLAKSGYWPVAVMDTPESGKGSGTASLTPWPAQNPAPKFNLGPLPRAWRDFFVLFTLAVAAYFVQNFKTCHCSYGRVRGYVHLNVWPNEPGWPSRLCYLSVCSFALIAMYGLFIAPLVSITRADSGNGAHNSAWIAVAFLCVFVVLGVGPLSVFFRGSLGALAETQGNSKAARRRAKPIPHEGWNFGILGATLLFVALFGWALAKLFGGSLHPRPGAPLDHQETFFFAFRSLHLTSGVAPMSPLLILLAAYFLWGRVHLNRVEMVHERLIQVPALSSDAKEEQSEAHAIARCEAAIAPLVNEPLPLRWRTAGAFLIMLGIHLYMTEPLRSFEYSPFDMVFRFTLAMLYSLMFLTLTRFLMIWVEFRRFLQQLERHHLRFAFDEMPKKRTISPLLQFSPRHTEFSTLVAVRENLAKLKPSGAWNATDLENVRQLDCEIGRLLICSAGGKRISREDAGALRGWLKKVNQVLLHDLQQEFWAGGHERKEATPTPDTLRQEIIALQYRDYIQYILHQQRNLLFFVVAGFMLSIFALHAYPFQGPQSITLFITAAFVGFASGVITVLAQAERDPILSRITESTPGQLNSGFFLRTAGYLGIPLVTVLSSQFPSWGRFLFSWIQPMLEAVK